MPRPPERLVVYVDGFNLYHGIHEATRHEYLWLDLVALARLLRPRSRLVAVKYFTATVLGEPEAQGRQDTYLRALSARHPEILTIVMGRYQRKRMRCSTCGTVWFGYEEKETDVNIAVELLADALGDTADAYIVISADSDLAPVVRKVRQMRPDAFVTAAFPPSRSSAELRSIMPASFTIGLDRISRAQLPEIVEDDAGIIHRRPRKWCSGHRASDPEP